MSETSVDMKPCPVCAELIKTAAVKCRFCSTDLTDYLNAKNAEVERVLFNGHPPVIFSASQWLVIPVLLALAFAAAIAGADLAAMTALAVLLILLRFLSYWVKSMSRRYNITTQRISIERGLLSKVRESLELFRIDHFEVHKPFGMRLLRKSALHLFTSDQELANFYIYGISGLEEMAETLRECQLRERARRGLTTFVKA